MSRNPYAPPKTPVTDAPMQEPIDGPAPHASRNWIQRRPVFVWIPFTLSSLQLVAVFSAMKDAHYLDAINDGIVSPVQALEGFAYPFLFFLGSALLLFLRRAAILVFATYLLWGIAKRFGGGSWLAYLDLTLVGGIWVYCWYLDRRGTLK